ncbi:MAG: flagellar biosynthesis anti-sigma factor FlgM [Candidatus Krumholzibacteriia bacterium]
MAMRNIDQANSPQGSLLRRLTQGGSGRGGVPAAGTGESGRPTAQPTGDSLVLSAAARREAQMQGDLSAAREALAALPDVREERVAEARARLDSGVYETTEVRGVVAGRLQAVLNRLGNLID